MSRKPDFSVLQTRWAALAPRERALLAAAAAVVAAALLWWVALAPALHTLRAAPARHAELDQQLLHMLTLKAEAQQLKNAPRAASTDTVASLRSTLTQRLPGTAQLQASGDRVTITLQGAPADGLAQWLAQARTNARAVPVEARIQRTSDAEAGKASSSPSMPRWNGNVVLALPPAR